MGNNVGVNFTSGSPVPFATTINTSEGSASVADVSTGALLFYTDGRTVWNNTGATMPGGVSIVPYSTSSSTQGALIVTSISDPNQYYIFSLEEVTFSGAFCRLNYTLVDMTLAGGLGDVVAGSAGLPVADNLGEKLTAIPGDNCNIWVVTHRRDSTKFLAFEITAAGLNPTPVVSTVGGIVTSGSYGSYGIGVMKASPNNRKVVTCSYNPGSTTAVGCELYDFNPTTGVFSNCIRLDSLNDHYGAEFSPDNTKLYAGDVSSGCTIYQYDITLGTDAAIRASQTSVASGSGYPQMDLAPDGKIYFPSLSSSGDLDCFSTPNGTGPGSGFLSNAVVVAPGSTVFGMPNLVVSTEQTIHNDSIICADTITIFPHVTGTAYVWYDGSTASSHIITDTGRYWVAIYTPGECTTIDSITVTRAPTDSATNRRDTVVCPLSSPYTLRGPSGPYTSYSWEDGTTGITHTITDSGMYWVYAIVDCSVYIDSIHVGFMPVDSTQFTRYDDTLCITTAPLTHSAPSGYTSYLWNTGSTASSISVSTSGTRWSYSRMTTGGSCFVQIDTFRSYFAPIPVINAGNDTAFCIGNTITLSSAQPAGSLYLWNTGSTMDNIPVLTSGAYWLRVTNANGKGCTNTDTVHVTVSPFPIVDLGPNQLECEGASILLQSSVTYTSPVYLWNTSSSAPSIIASSTGTYWLQVTVAGCTSADTTEVKIVFDTINLLNNDTAICMGQSIRAMVNVNPLAFVQWLPTAGIANANLAYTLITPDTSAMYYVLVSLDVCPVKKDSFYLDVQPNPIVYIEQGNRAMCEFDTIHLNATVTPKWYTQYAYNWTPTTNVDDPAVKDIVFKAGDSTHMFLTVTTPAGCTGSDSVLINVHPGNFATITNDTNICPRDSVQLLAQGGFMYNWYPGIYLSDSTVGAPWLHAITSQHYTMVATSIYGCKDTLETSITVRANAVLFLGDSVTLHPGESYQINPQGNCTNFTWFPPAGLDYANIPNPTATPLVSTKYIVNGSTEWGCVAKDSIVIRFDEESLIGVPNAFAPGNGPNGKFQVIRRGTAMLNHFRVYNRWGNVVFSTTNIDEGWDGTFNGQPQPFGVYVYEVEAVTTAGTIIHKQGNVTLIR